MVVGKLLLGTSIKQLKHFIHSFNLLHWFVFILILLFIWRWVPSCFRPCLHSPPTKITTYTNPIPHFSLKHPFPVSIQHWTPSVPTLLSPVPTVFDCCIFFIVIFNFVVVWCDQSYPNIISIWRLLINEAMRRQREEVDRRYELSMFRAMATFNCHYMWCTDVGELRRRPRMMRRSLRARLSSRQWLPAVPQRHRLQLWRLRRPRSLRRPRKAMANGYAAGCCVHR